jgi:transcriptional regulator of arginine metabolism
MGMEVMKRARQQAIGDLVFKRPIHTQAELVTALDEKGFRATQATVSRDIAEMGLTKVSRMGSRAYALPTSDAVVEQSGGKRLAQLLQDLPIEIRESGTLLVIRAVPGSAHAIAAALDRARWPDVLGTIAGDDTLFIACPDLAALKRTRKRLIRLGS